MENQKTIVDGKREKEIMHALYMNVNGLSNKELCALLRISPSNVTVVINRLNKNYNPPLVHIERNGKFSHYVLTEDGKKYYEKYLYNKHPNTPFHNNDLGTILIANILNQIDPSITNSLVQDIKRIGADMIISTMNVNEFFFLALNLGMITPKPMTAAEAIKIVFPNVKEDDYMEYSKSIYEKLKQAILKMKMVDLGQELDQEIFECQNEGKSPKCNTL